MTEDEKTMLRGVVAMMDKIIEGLAVGAGRIEWEALASSWAEQTNNLRDSLNAVDEKGQISDD